MGPAPTPSAQIRPSGRAGGSLLAGLALVVVGVMACGCGQSAGAEGHAGGAGRPHSAPAAGTSAPTEEESAAAEAATAIFRTDIDDATAAFVTGVDRLQAAVDTGARPEAQADELAAQADYDRFRLLEGGDQTTAATLDELDSEVGGHQSFGGLHAVERDLWTSGDAADDITGLVAQAPVAQYLLDKEVLAPEAIGTTAVDELGWVDDMAVPGREELYSRRDAVDITATVSAAHDAFVALRPLGQLVDPSVTASADRQFTGLLALVGSLGDPAHLRDQDISGASRLALSQHVDATAAELSQLAAALAPFGTTGPSS